jgi:ligand-binding sensor protein
MYDYDLNKLQQLLQDFYNLTQIKTCIYDNAGNELCFYPQKFSAFCSLLRQDPVMDERCKSCDMHAFSECKKTRKQYAYTCHAGLLECLSPIVYDDTIIGFIILGQIKTNANAVFPLSKEQFSESTWAELKKRFEELPIIEPDKLDSSMHILDACTRYGYLKNSVHFYKDRIDSRIDAYINKSLAEPLSVPILCSKFMLSHSELYSIFKTYFFATPADYIKTRRLEYAYSLLTKTDLPVNKIAQQCGIPDYNYFSKLFKKQFHTSPREVRKQMDKNLP